ncbi:MAG: hypothetical protein A3D28_04715 [Omnitrophica bacterium RIFCSPHIGHO2_02_FULL_63_14]|nr:MAG: hypothetical protein A3D28_04715 [Omnitrophica bacterium RIFCSPHIGHO2_02_FULL_63_14]
MSLKIRTSQKSFLSLESVAMTDIVMNLFIFFFISFSLLYTFNPRRESKIEVKLPEGQKGQGARAETPLVVTVTSGNEIFIGKTRVAVNELRKRLKEKLGSAGDAGLVVRADRSASVDTLVKVLDGAKGTGYKRLGVAIQEAPLRDGNS